MHWIDTLEKAGELVRIKEYVNPHLEITEIVDRISETDVLHHVPDQFHIEIGRAHV